MINTGVDVKAGGNVFFIDGKSGVMGYEFLIK